MPEALTQRLPSRRLPVWFAASAAAYFLLLKLVLAVFGQVQIDEAYYWMWGQHPQLSYVDHPGLNAWVQGLMSLMFGTNVLALRVAALITSGVTLWLLQVWCRRLAGEGWLHAWLLGAALYFSSPLSVFVTTMALHEHLMLLFGMLALHCFAGLGDGYARSGRVSLPALYAGAVFIGLAVLTKFIAVSVGLGIAAGLAMRSETRGLYRSPHMWIAALVAVALQAPTLAWNLQHGLLTVTFHLGGVGRVGASGPDILGAWHILFEAVLLLSPFCIWGMLRYLASRSAPEGFGGVLHDLGRAVFVASTLLVFLVEIALGKFALYYWNMLAYCSFLGLAVWFIRSRPIVVLHLTYAAILTTFLVVHFSFHPILPRPLTANLYGWEQLVAAMEEARLESDAEFLAADSWQHASKLGFTLADPRVVAITPTADAYDQWFRPADYEGRDGIILAGEGALPYLQTRFESVTLLKTVEVSSRGVPVFSHIIYLGRGFHPAPDDGI